MSDSVRPHRRQPTRLPRPWDSPGKNTGVGTFVTAAAAAKSLQSCPTLCDPIDGFLYGPTNPIDCFLYGPTNLAINLISDSSAFSKFKLYIWKFLFHVLLKLSLKRVYIYIYRERERERERENKT